MAHLAIHVLNGGYGESIVVEMPDGSWGVIDCYTRKLKDSTENPTVDFLRKREVRELKFVCLTHPHVDHFRGIRQLVEAFPPKEFWKPGCLTRESLVDLVLLFCLSEKSGEYLKQSAEDLRKGLRIISDLRKNGDLRIVRFSDIKTSIPQDGNESEVDFVVKGISPSSNLIEQYEESLGKCFTSEGELNREAPELRHNLISIALLLKFKRFRILLGGDAEVENWEETLSQCNKADLASDVVKVSHHGSVNGYTDELWAIITKGKKTKAVITPSTRHGLPRAEGVSHILKHASELYVTSQSSVDSQCYQFPSSYNFQMAAAIRSQFKTFISNEPDNFGVCSFYLEPDNDQVAQSLEGDATQLNI